MNKKTVKTENNDIIVASATAEGTSALAIIRLSGKGSKNIVEKLTDSIIEKPRTFYLRDFKTSKIIENAMTVFFKEDASYTGEESAEIYCHGNKIIVNEIIQECIKNGARLAKGGEFTFRAFKNNKINLYESEAVIDIIEAETVEQINYAFERLKGTTFGGIVQIEEKIKSILSLIEAVFHYGDELEKENTDQEIKKIKNELKIIRDNLNEIIQDYNGGKQLREGVSIAIIGSPNSGKSTLLNKILNYERAIVTDIEGTTRDLIEESFIFNGRKFVITDTAGIRESLDKVEIIGMERAKKAAQNADIIINLADNKDNFIKGDFVGKKVLYVLNKCDNSQADDFISKNKDLEIIKISAKYGNNIELLKQKIYDLSDAKNSGICNTRQLECIKKACDYIDKAASLNTENQLEIIDSLCYDAHAALGEIFGFNSPDKVIEDVFKRFCVGK